MATEKKYLDKHTLYVLTGAATHEQFDKSVKSAIAKSGLKSAYEVNIVINRDGKRLGFGYVRFSNTILYHLLDGKNADGSKRVEKRPNPNYVPRKETVEEKSAKLVLDSKAISEQKAKIGKWADVEDDDEEEDNKFLYKNLPALLTLEPFKLTEQQLEDAKNKPKDGWDQNEDIEEYGKFIVNGGAFVKEQRDDYYHDQLYIQRLDNKVTPEMLRNHFVKYNTNSSAKIRGRPYPDVRIMTNNSQGRSAYIAFNPNTRDAQFAMLMCHKTMLNGVLTIVTFRRVPRGNYDN